MALISRVSRLFTADVNAVLDRIEEPDVLLKQSIREMEDAVVKGEQHLNWLRHEVRQLETKRDAGIDALHEFDSELDICFEAGEEELARTLVKRKLTEERDNKAAVAQLDSVTSAIVDLDATLADQRDKLAEMQHNAELLTKSSIPHVGSEATIGQDEVDVAFLREKQRRTGA